MTHFLIAKASFYGIIAGADYEILLVFLLVLIILKKRIV